MWRNDRAETAAYDTTMPYAYKNDNALYPIDPALTWLSFFLDTSTQS